MNSPLGLRSRRPLLAVSLVLAALVSVPTSAQTPRAPAEATVQAPTAQERDRWRAAMARKPVPKTGCFTTAYPSTEWKEVPCVTPPPRPYPPARGPRPVTVGNNTDWTANSASGAISTAIGSFDSVTGVTNESDAASGNADTFSLQLNTNRFNTPACNNVAGCVGWQQFVFSNGGCTVGGMPAACAFMQYWLINFGPMCPGAQWQQTPQAPNDCFQSTPAVIVPTQTIAGLAAMTLTGTAANGGNDTISLSVGNPPTLFNQANADNVLNLAQNWNQAEFNVFGDCCDNQANFNNGSTLVVRTSVNEGVNLAPTCVQAGFTGETNNLTLSTTPTVVPAALLPSIVFTESNPPSGVASCAASKGDTHLTTVSGLHYDFQASGEFLLAEIGPDLVVHTRQVSGAPNWPNAAVNKAVATRMGKTVVAICVAPTRLVINGKAAQLADGKALGLPDGVTLSRSGNVYLIRRQNGDSVSAQLNHVAQPLNDWIDVSVGLGDGSQIPKVRGLLGNPDGNVNEIALRDGTVLKEPVSFEDLYHRYADSWRIPPDQSLLCKEKNVKSGIPAKPFYASDLNPEQYKRARAICTKAGVTHPSALEDCMIDVTVLGSELAALVFVRTPVPVAVMQAGSRGYR